MTRPIPLEVPPPAELWEMRRQLGLSAEQLGSALNFGPNGARTVSAWEVGHRNGEEFKPKPTAWAAFRYLFILVEAYRALPAGSAVRHNIGRLLPEELRL